MSTNTNELTWPKPGETRIHDCVVVAFTKLHDGGQGFLPHGVALLVDTREDSYHPYVVWTLMTSDGKTWRAESGSYCLTIEEGAQRYKDRGGK